jgi:hypothetical protein
MTDKMVSQTTARAIAKCTTCKKVRRITFTMVSTQWAYQGRMAGSQAAQFEGGPLVTFRDKHDLNHMLHRNAGQCDCGAKASVKLVKGVYVADKACNDKCMGATGPSCECQCGGQNHGGKFG